MLNHNNLLINKRKLPDGWRWVRLGDACEFTYGSSLPAHSREEGTVPVYGSNGVVGYHNHQLTNGPTIVIGRKGSIGEIHFSEVACWPIDTTYFIEHPKIDIDIRWLSHWLRGLNLTGLNKAAAVPGLNRDDACALEIPLPPLSEQKRIAAILNEQMAAVERAKAAAESQLEAATSLPAAYLRAVFNSSEAQQWPRKRLGEVGCFESGGTPSKENPSYWEGHIPFVTGADITDFYISSKNARAFLTEEGLTSGKTAICHRGTVLLVTRTRVGRVGIATETMGASQDLSPYICGQQLFPEYVCRYLVNISDYLLASCRGATIQGLTRDFVHTLEIPLPPLSEQQRISAKLSEQMSAVERVRKSVAEQLDLINRLPEALLKSAFSGTI